VLHTHAQTLTLSDFGLPEDSVVFLVVRCKVKLSEIEFFESGRTPLRNSVFRIQSTVNTLYKENRLFLRSETLL